MFDDAMDIYYLQIGFISLFFFTITFTKDYVMWYVVEGIVDMFNFYYGDGVLIHKLRVHNGFNWLFPLKGFPCLLTKYCVM
jgi:hypothetical protein